MKNIKTNLLAVITLVASFGAFASDPEAESKTVEKAREAVESAKNYDWQTLAKSAEKCFYKNQNIDQALQWLDQSIEIDANPVNLEIKGNYYRSNGQPQKAMEFYYKAIISGKEQNFWFDTNKLQEKIWDIKSATPEKLEKKGNYHSSIGDPKKATEYYYQAIIAGKSLDPSFDTASLQEKIWNLR